MNIWRTNDFQRVHLITAQISLTVLWKKSKWYLFVEQSVLWLSRLTIIACGLYLLRVTLVTLIIFSEAFILPVDNDLQMRCPRTMAPLIDKWSEKQLRDLQAPVQMDSLSCQPNQVWLCFPVYQLHSSKMSSTSVTPFHNKHMSNLIVL